ncbi:hypothetical protein BN946_scf184791.g7 [Trametes cinnabarina]|uniref:Uncharacterized protein n=1 Tax=Pycnoporus cinnabarinus TaxID=5643 RepID=A0A060S4P4_PYCCI|nr:hypothetical protein BN946_scf184791.g7 [Trametes cinnabarina]
MAKLSTFEGFVCGGLAGCTAVTFSNPAEVAKTRMQLQGELMRRGGVKVYSNVFDALIKTWRNEGLRGVQRGLGPAYVYQLPRKVLLNGSRLGFYEPSRRWLNKMLGYSPTQQTTLTSMSAGSISTVIGSCLGNPLFLVKTRMQAYSPVLPVGAQRYYKHAFHALSTIIREEGLRGLLRGIDAACFRGAIGGSVQLPSYLWAKQLLVSHGVAAPDSMVTYLLSSSIAGVVLPTVQGPDGRMIGTLYKNPFDCLWKTFKTEGLYGWYKGSTAHFLRIAPHTIITLTANDLIIRSYTYLKSRSHRD